MAHAYCYCCMRMPALAAKMAKGGHVMIETCFNPMTEFGELTAKQFRDTIQYQDTKMTCSKGMHKLFSLLENPKISEHLRLKFKKLKIFVLNIKHFSHDKKGLQDWVRRFNPNVVIIDWCYSR